MSVVPHDSTFVEIYDPLGEYLEENSYGQHHFDTLEEADLYYWILLYAGFKQLQIRLVESKTIIHREWSARNGAKLEGKL